MNSWREFGTVGSGVQLVHCTGNETQGLSCTSSLDNDDNGCDHFDDAGVRCQGKNPLPYW